MTNILKLSSVSLRNFMSYGNNTTVVQLDRPGTTFIVGQDLDNTTNGTSSNGVGKTTLLNAIVYALYNRALSDDVTVDGLINITNKKNMEVTLDFSIGDEYFRVVRARKMKSGPSGNYVKFYRRKGDPNFVEGDDTSKGHSVYDTDADILDVVKLKFDVFTRIVVFSAMKESFFQLPLRSHGTSKKANQTDFIEEIFGLTELSEKALALKEQSKDLTKSLNEAMTKLQFQERERSRYEEQLASAKRRVQTWERQREEAIKAIEDTLTHYSSFDFVGQMELLNRLVSLDEVAARDRKRLTALEKQLKTATKDMDASRKELKVLEGDQCPYCMQAFADNKHKADECSSNIELLAATIEGIETEMCDVKQKIEEVERCISDAEASLIDKTLTMRDLEELKRTVEAGQAEIERLNQSTNPFTEPLCELEASEIPPADYTEVNELTKRVDHFDFLYKLLTKKDSFVRKSLLNKNLPYLNQRLQGYLVDLGLSHKVEFTHELTAKITQFGRDINFGNLSAGQKARVNIALSFAFRDVLQLMHMPVNICLLDEILDVGLNSNGAQMAIKMLKKIAREEKMSMYVISHREEVDSAFDRTLTVQMSKGFSYVFIDDGASPLVSE